MTNPLQGDLDEDGVGDECDPDLDGDGKGLAGEHVCSCVRVHRHIGWLDSWMCTWTDEWRTDLLVGRSVVEWLFGSGDGARQAAEGGIRDFWMYFCVVPYLILFFIEPAGILNTIDKCPSYPDPMQVDSDKDGVGDLCDNCPSVINRRQVSGAPPSPPLSTRRTPCAVRWRDLMGNHCVALKSSRAYSTHCMRSICW